MKSPILVFSIISILFANTLPAQTTNTWSRLEPAGLTGTTFKMPVTARPGLLLGLHGIHYNKPSLPAGLFATEQYKQLEAFLYNDPVFWAQFSEFPGSEIWLGTPSGPGSFGPVQTTALSAYGLAAVLPLGRNWAVQGAVTTGKYSARSTFPVTIVRFTDGTQPGTEIFQAAGAVQATIRHWQLQSAVRYYLPATGLLQAFAGLGAAYTRSQTSPFQTTLGDARWSFGSSGNTQNWSGLLQAGCSVQPERIPVFVELSAGLQQVFDRKSGGMQYTLQATAGYIFRSK